MEDDESSMVLNAKLNMDAAETSDSGNSNYKFRASKRSRHETTALLARFKGVVPQQNGHWGAQIYANHQRIWLGTFKSEKEAAMAYDSAAVKLRSGDSHRNFPWTDHNIQEPNFQNMYSIEDILNMIRDGSYQTKSADFVKILSKRDGKLGTNLNKNLVHGDIQFTCLQLFQKELTPSDVGKLNRLVIPKKYAVKYFPYICENDQQSLIGGGVEDVELVFYDKLMRTWKFRCINEEVFNRLESSLHQDNLKVQLELNLGKNFFCGVHNSNTPFNEEKALKGLRSSHNVKEKRITLFGVQIN
ncbi:hypothetical protein CRYUN_Cryun25bG0050400 [Craigia yunnanensis]